MGLIHQTCAVLAFFTTISMIHSRQTSDDIIGALQNLTKKVQALQPSADSIDRINAPLVVIGLGPLADVINGYESIVTSTIDYVYTFYGSEIISRTEDEESIAQVYNQFVNANHVIFKIIYYKADLFEGHGYVGEDLTKALRKLEGVYDSYSFAIESVTPHANSTIHSWHTDLMIGLKTAYDRWKSLGTTFEGSQVSLLSPQSWPRIRDAQTQQII